MKNKEIEKRIYDEFESRKPDLFSKIIEQCPKMNNQKPKESILTKLRNLVPTKRLSYSFATVSLVVILAFVFALQGESPSTEAFSVIAIDVNPSVVIELDEDNKVISVVLNNEDAEIIVGDMDLIGVDYNVAVNALIGSMVVNGYINEIANSILLSISSGDETRKTEIMEKLTLAINEVLTGNQIEGSLIIQNLEFEDDAEELAEMLNISEAKAELIIDIVKVDPRMIVEELALLSINDLNLLLEAKNIVLDNVDKKGNASILSILTVEEVYQIALDELGLNETEIIEYSIELEQEDGIMVYEIEIETNSNEYELLIEAKKGTVYIDIDDNDEMDDDFFDSTLDILSYSELFNMIVTILNLNQSEIFEFEYSEEKENGIVFFDVSFEYYENEFELEVDAITGEIYSNSMDEDGFDSDENDESQDETD